jgi:hypothetical protein
MALHCIQFNKDSTSCYNASLRDLSIFTVGQQAIAIARSLTTIPRADVLNRYRRVLDGVTDFQELPGRVAVLLLQVDLNHWVSYELQGSHLVQRPSFEGDDLSALAFACDCLDLYEYPTPMRALMYPSSLAHKDCHGAAEKIEIRQPFQGSS